MDWKDVRYKAVWTFVEALLGALVTFLVALESAWVEAGEFVLPMAAVVALGSGLVGALAAAATVVKEWGRRKREARRVRA